jgi:adenosylcobinamide-GDP ribazoletransferase
MFLTRIPVGRGLVLQRAGEHSGADTPLGRSTGGAAFGLVGALVGAAGAVPLLLAGDRAPLAAGVLAVAALALVSGALHMDGLADTVDALAAPSPDAADRARRDPRVGPAGAAAIVVVVAVDAALLASIVDIREATVAGLGCLAAGSGSRAVAPVAAWLAGRRRRADGQAGLGAWFIGRAHGAAAATASLTALLVGVGAGLLAGAPAFAAAVVGGTVVATALSIWLREVRGNLDGDGFGFLVELAFATILLFTVMTL